MTENKIFYCKTGGHYWEYDGENEPSFICWHNEVEQILKQCYWYSQEDFDNAEDRYCGCTE